MSRPRLDAEHKKVSFSLAFSPNVISALERVRGARSQSVFVEQWLRQQPQIAAELAAMHDPGFAPPIARYERLMELLLEFYAPEDGKHTSLARVLFVAHKVIVHHQSGTDKRLEEQIVAALEAFVVQERHKHGDRIASGDSLEAIRPRIEEYARYFYEVVFLDMARGERKLLQQHFRTLVRGCEAVYRKQARAQA